MTGLPRVAVLGVDVATAAATISLVDGGLAVAAFSSGPVPPAAHARLAAYGCADQVLAVSPGTLRLTAAGPAAPPFEVHGVRADPRPSATSAAPAAAVAAAGAGAGDDLLGVFDAVVLGDGTARLGPGGPDSPRFGGVFDLAAAWVFHVGGPPELAGAQGRWIGEYLRGRYAPPEPAAMSARPALLGRSTRGGVRAELAELDRELRAGHARAAGIGYRLPTPPARLTPAP
ncbi:hypothetical protein FF36_00728 [Frankia torreyi]|uniref:Uncharacterized protein n=2 Tax=Frankia TaxID=1854 RepID=A0A0D8BLU5_9ACTN|nr:MULTISPECIES: hypothetical protein [Frankia]KJE25116.1 hypothetical protein FF36_00728 [Frankia torreyi]KQC36943.1 hypothetical protein UK82_18300 [Frankia sp. ACN1ag]KQM07309.1 hypothetical protein FF86_1004208 [Frankia sp. CpI1-P]